MTVELNTAEVIMLELLLKRQAVQSLKLSKDKALGEVSRNVFRKDFHKHFNLYKKIRGTL